MRALAFVLALVAGPFGFAGQPEKNGLPRPLPENIVKAWKDAGATVGWMKVDESGILSFLENPEAGAVPAFRFLKWKEGVVAKLPVPESSFGLYLSKTEVMDAGLKELANLRTLASLCLCETEVTVDAVAALQKALPKCFIFHC
ncbi:MAG: hypothetical protein WCL32_24645 [Planctomycetota bacterium]